MDLSDGFRVNTDEGGGFLQRKAKERVSFLVRMANRFRPSGQRLQIDASPTT